MADSKFGLPNLKIGTQTWNSKFGLPNLKIGQIPSLGTTNILKGSGQQLKVQHEYLMMTRTHTPTTIAQSPTSIEYKLTILYLALLSITAVGHPLWSSVDYDQRTEQYSVTYISMIHDHCIAFHYMVIKLKIFNYCITDIINFVL